VNNVVDGSARRPRVRHGHVREVHDQARRARVVAQRVTLGVALRRSDKCALDSLNCGRVGQAELRLHERRDDLRACGDARVPIRRRRAAADRRRAGRSNAQQFLGEEFDLLRRTQRTAVPAHDGALLAAKLLAKPA
jgi:hypothetical protein